MNIINAVINLVNNPNVDLLNYNAGHNRANAVGDALEEYVKTIFAGTFGIEGKQQLELLNSTFSYLGNNSNPPDAMLRGGDAIEVKKIEKDNALLALNSSYPKHKLYANSPMISDACRNAEEWKEKDIIYVVGVANNNKLRHLCMVYGMDYCASDGCYSGLKKTIKSGVENIPSVEFEETRELGRINRVDPLGITYMRVRGMWGIENPWNVFNYIYERNTNKEFNFMCIINDVKWNSFDNTNDLMLLEKINDNLTIEKVRIKNPNNPAQLVDARLISFSV